MLLELALRHEKKDHQINGLSVHRIELNSFLRTTDGCYRLRDQVRRSVRKANARPDSRAHRGFTFFDASAIAPTSSGLILRVATRWLGNSSWPPTDFLPAVQRPSSSDR